MHMMLNCIILVIFIEQQSEMVIDADLGQLATAEDIQVEIRYYKARNFAHLCL